MNKPHRFWMKVTDAPEAECWVWGGNTNEKGYGRYGHGDHETVLAHRLAYEHLVGPIPPGMTIDHQCNNPPCVNPRHLVIATRAANTERNTAPPQANAAKTHCVRGHEFTPQNTGLDRRGHRYCMACNREACRRRRAAIKDGARVAGRVRAVDS